MTARQSFKTAVARRRNEPLILELEDTPTEGETATFRIDPILDVARFGALFSEFMTGAKALPTDESGNPTVSDAEVIAYLDDLELRGRNGQNALESCIHPDDRERFAAIKQELDLGTLVAVTNWLSQEITGRHPTSPGSSSDGSSSTGTSSMDGSGAGPVPMPPPSPSPLP